MSNSIPCLLQLIKQLHDIPNEENLNLVSDKSVHMFLLENCSGHEIGFNTIKLIQFEKLKLKNTDRRLEKLN